MKKIRYSMIMVFIISFSCINMAKADTSLTDNTNRMANDGQTTLVATTLPADENDNVPSIDTVSSNQPTFTNDAINSSSDEHVIWNKQPIAFVIPTNKERMITFPDTVELINNNPDLTADKVNITINNGTLYMKALQSFSPIRVTVKLQQHGEHVLLDISSEDEADDTPVDVVLASSANQGSDNDAKDQTNKPLSYIDLLRFAIQSLYAPERLISQSADIVRAPMYTQKSVSLFYGANTIAMPIISWQGGDEFVTAVIIKNTQSHAIVLDPRYIKGNWLASASYPTNQLTAMGSQHDKTTLFLISEVPFGQALATGDEERRV